MEYQVESIIDAPAHTAFKAYTDPQEMKKWIMNLSDIVSYEGELFMKHSYGKLIFSGDGIHEMDVYVSEYTKDQLIEFIYSVPGVVNKVKCHFESQQQQTRFLMDVVFIFDDPHDLPLEQFVESTRRSMKAFKDFIENEVKL